MFLIESASRTDKKQNIYLKVIPNNEHSATAIIYNEEGIKL